MFFEMHSESQEQHLVAENKMFFISIAQHPGQKLIPMIPILDAGFEVWFKVSF